MGVLEDTGRARWPGLACAGHVEKDRKLEPFIKNELYAKSTWDSEELFGVICAVKITSLFHLSLVLEVGHGASLMSCVKTSLPRFGSKS